MERLQTVLFDGGPIVYILLALSLISLALIGVKVLQLMPVMSGEAERDAAFAQWKTGDKQAAIEAMADGRSPADRIVREAMLGLKANTPRAALESDLAWRGSNEVAGMNRHIRLLELIAMVSPLMGLLGTVLGMIQSFQELALAEGAANAALLAGGIWQALLTTAAGLIVAIPASIGATMLSERAERATQRIEASVGQLFALEDSRN